jgi:3-carboxy-cis,cis-muconate cycloisomerase
MMIYDRLFRDTAVSEIFSAVNTVQRMLDFEAALARAESQTGVIPEHVSAPIVSQCRVDLFDLGGLADRCGQAGNLAIPVVEQLTALVDAVDHEAAGYVHWGATSQDVIDTALVLQLRDALSVMHGELARLHRTALRLAEAHRATPVVARTWMQHALPTVLGLQFAGWADALDRHMGRLREVGGRALVLQFGGAGGTLASLGAHGLEVGTGIAASLELEMPVLSWHAHRDRIAEVATTLALLTGTLAKIARDIALQSQTEIAELAEPAAPGRGGSSSMPHKQNPVACAIALAAAVRIPGLAAGILTGMVQEHERGLGGWQAEWESVPEIVCLAAGSLHQMLHAVDGLSVDVARMQRNLEASQGRIYSEPVTLALAKRMGRSEARTVVERASQRAAAEGRHLQDVLAADAVVAAYLTTAELGQLFAPLSCRGVSQEFIDRVLHAGRREQFGDAGE